MSLILHPPWTVQPPSSARIKQQYRNRLLFAANPQVGYVNLASNAPATTLGGLRVGSRRGLAFDTDSSNGLGVGVYPSISIAAGSDYTTLCVYGEDATGADNGRVWQSATGTTHFLINTVDGHPYIRVAGTNVLLPGSGFSIKNSATRSTVARVASSAFVDFWCDGLVRHSATHSVAVGAHTITKWGSDSTEECGDVLLIAHWDRLLTNSEAAELSGNPWSLFEPRRIWMPVSAAGGTAAITAAAGAATASQLTGSSTAESAITSAAGASTASALVGKATSVAEISGATGAATASQLTGSSTARASFGAGAGVATASQLPGTSTARADFGAAAGVATGETLVGSSGSSAITVAAGVATAAALVGKSTARADFGVAAGAATASEMAGTTGSYAIDPASGMASAAVLAGSSIAVASFTPAAGVATAATMAGPSSTTVYFWRRTA